MAEQKYQIDTAKSVDDFENCCLQPSNGAEYSFKNGIKALELGNGGVIREVGTGRQCSVNPGIGNPLNDWIYQHWNQTK